MPKARNSTEKIRRARPKKRRHEFDATSPDEMFALFDALRLSSNAAGRLLGVNMRTVRRWTAGETEIPPPVGRFLRYLHRQKIEPIHVMEVLGE